MRRFQPPKPPPHDPIRRGLAGAGLDACSGTNTPAGAISRNFIPLKTSWPSSSMPRCADSSAGASARPLIAFAAWQMKVILQHRVEPDHLFEFAICVGRRIADEIV